MSTTSHSKKIEQNELSSFPRVVKDQCHSRASLTTSAPSPFLFSSNGSLLPSKPVLPTSSSLSPRRRSAPGQTFAPSSHPNRHKQVRRRHFAPCDLFPMSGRCVRSAAGLLCLALLLSATAWADGKNLSVTYDARSLIIHGKRELLVSGSIHYPRSTPEMWPDLIKKAKKGGINVIQTYVFWNGHEPVKGQYYFEGRFDLLRFVKEVQKQGLHVSLRIGPFIQAEWNHGGFPYWLREEPGILFRTDNEPFKQHMDRFVRYIVDMMKKENMFAPQGGPIILAQIENEYNMVQAAFKEGGSRYVQWAGNLALSTNAGVPWIMCKQKDAPGPIINACNGRNCGDTFTGPNHPTKPAIWAENWTAQYRVFGDPPSQRSAEDIAYGVARFFSKNGTLVNYYMYHGGTNFGRTGASFVTTRYYDEAPLDEYGLMKEPKWGHLKDLHQALRLAKKALFWGDYSVEILGRGLEARLYQTPGSNVCSAFLSNSNAKVDATVTFRGQEYFLPRHSISILPDCKNVVYNTQRVNAQHNSRTFHTSKEAQANNKWEMYQEHIPIFSDTSVRSKEPLELFNMTKDTTDYLWYTTSFELEDDDLPRRTDIRPVVQVSSLGHALVAFANGGYIGDGHGTKVEKSFVFQKPMTLKPGKNHLSILGMHVGFPDSGAYLEHRHAGIHTVSVQGLNTGTFDLTSNRWGHQVGLIGEKQEIYSEAGISRVRWSPAQKGTPVTWYKRYFDAPRGGDPVVVDLSTMGKGMVWINGENIGRYWISYLSPLGKASQQVYHVPRGLLKPTNNLMVVFEESGGSPEGILVMTVRRDNICAYVSEYHPGHVKAWRRENSAILKVTDVSPQAQLTCPEKKAIKAVVFADFGSPGGMCGSFTRGNCTAPQTKAIVEKACLGKRSCKLKVNPEAYGADPNCPWSSRTLAVEAKCSRKKSDN